MRRGRRSRRDEPAVGPGMPGGRYRPLTQSDEKQIHSTVLDVLENIGMGDPIPIVEECALQRGCFMNQHGRLCFPKALVEDVVASTPKNIQFMGRDPKHDMELGGIRDDYIVLVGGAPLNEEFGDAIGADAYCRDAATAVDVAKELVASAS